MLHWQVCLKPQLLGAHWERNLEVDVPIIVWTPAAYRCKWPLNGEHHEKRADFGYPILCAFLFFVSPGWKHHLSRENTSDKHRLVWDSWWFFGEQVELPVGETLSDCIPRISPLLYSISGMGISTTSLWKGLEWSWTLQWNHPLQLGCLCAIMFTVQLSFTRCSRIGSREDLHPVCNSTRCSP